MKVLLYTAVYGRYDKPKVHTRQNIPMDYVLISEKDGICLPNSLQNRHPRYKAKYWKLQPYALENYRQYDYVIWIDGSGTLLAPDSLEKLLRYCNKGYAVFRHPDRDCIYEECLFCQDFEKYRSQPLQDQVEAYRKEGYPRRNGLYAGGFIIRDTKKDFTYLDTCWLEENLKWSYQDQLSLPYLLWKYHVAIDVIDLDMVKNDCVRFYRESWTK